MFVKGAFFGRGVSLALSMYVATQITSQSTVDWLSLSLSPYFFQDQDARPWGKSQGTDTVVEKSNIFSDGEN